MHKNEIHILFISPVAAKGGGAAVNLYMENKTEQEKQSGIGGGEWTSGWDETAHVNSRILP